MDPIKPITSRITSLLLKSQKEDPKDETPFDIAKKRIEGVANLFGVSNLGVIAPELDLNPERAKAAKDLVVLLLVDELNLQPDVVNLLLDMHRKSFEMRASGLLGPVQGLRPGQL